MQCQKCAKDVTSMEHFHQDLKLCSLCVLETIDDLQLKILQLKKENKELSQYCKDQHIHTEKRISLIELKVQQEKLLEQVKICDSNWVSIPETLFDEQTIPAFEMLETAVTFEMYDHYCELNQIKAPSDEGWGRQNRPVIHVNYAQIQTYIDWLNQQTDWKCSLPTQEQWENACRAGSITHYWYGDAADYRMMVFDTDKTQPTPGKRPANPWGLYDMHGNVWEWTC